jgi:hypothetical protein
MGIGQDSLQAAVPLLDSHLRSLSWEPSSRTQLAASSFAIALDHQAAIASLLRAGHHASAYVLLRPLFEATVKGSWLSHSATESAVARHARGYELPVIAQLLDDLGKSEMPAFLYRFLLELKTDGWQHLSSLTHAGFAQVRRWVASTGVAPQYPEEELEEIANITGLVGMVACIEAARLCRNAGIVEELESKFPR